MLSEPDVPRARTYQGFNLHRLERSFAFALLLLASRPTAQEEEGEGEGEADTEPK